MFTSIKHLGTRWKLVSVLVLLVMLPAIVFSVYEFSTLSRSETLIGDVYRQQLDVVLFSLNQYAWDVANSWANTIHNALSVRGRGEKDLASVLAPFLEENAGVRCLFIADSLAHSAKLYYPDDQPRTTENITSQTVVNSLRLKSDAIDQLARLRTTGYRKINPIYIHDEAGRPSLALIFLSAERTAGWRIAGIVIDADQFIRRVLGRRMEEAAGENFLLSVSQKGSGQVIYATGDVTPGEPRQTRDLWLLPDYTVGIRLRGQTIEDVVQARFYRNLLLIGLLNVVLIAGVWVVYRTVRRETELAQMKSDFVSNVSHEIKTPLALIRMFAETLQLKRIRSAVKKQEYYDTIVQETERLTRLINNILNFSRMEAGRKEYHFEQVNLNEIVDGVLKNYHLHLEREGFTVSKRIVGELPPINADRGAVSEAILNIIDNSVKYSPNEKHLSVTTGIDRTAVYVDVEDRGVGIDPEQQKRIFEKFYRVSSGLVHNTRGTGLGLALVKHIMEAHKGSITLRSEPGKGSTFRLSFPKYSGEHT